MEILSKQASQMILDQLDILSRIAVDQQYTLQSALWEPYRKIGFTKSLRDTGYHFSYLAESLSANDPSLFLDYTAWVKVLFAGLNFKPSVLTTTLSCMKQAMQEKLPTDLAFVACSYIEAAMEHLPHVPETLKSFISPESPHYELAKKYLDALLQGDRKSASLLILDAADHGVNVKDIYLNVFQPSQQEVGRLWQMNQVSVAQEHFCTGATQMIMSQLYPRIFATQKNGRKLVATSVGGELHEIGVRMVTDFLEMEGWDTYYLGANTPAESILRIIEERQADVVAISATISFHVTKVAELVDQIRTATDLRPVKIMVGGYPFNVASDLWQQVGADGYARNAQDAVAVANRMLGSAQ
ncbi:MAG: cobalamin B12-binding domain protein [Anaerolineaceae bacterium]|nr:cobalamin B12-binding domain protein [Anaerolineaceae bacterium]